MNKSLYLSGILLLVIGVLVGSIYLSSSKSSDSGKNLGAEILANATSTNSSSTATSSAATQLVDARPQTNYRSFTNLASAGQSVSIGCVSTSTGFAYGSGYILTPSSTWNTSEEEGTLCRGKMFFISASGTPTISIYQFP